jgi:hypothetical protein
MHCGGWFLLFRRQRCYYWLRICEIYKERFRFQVMSGVINTESWKFIIFKREVSFLSFFEVLWDKKVPCTLGWPYTEGTWLYCDYFIWCVSCTVVVLTCFVMCGWVCVGVFWQLCPCFGDMCTCTDCVLYCLYCVFVLFRLCIFIICFVCTSVRATATE